VTTVCFAVFLVAAVHRKRGQPPAIPCLLINHVRSRRLAFGWCPIRHSKNGHGHIRPRHVLVALITTPTVAWAAHLLFRVERLALVFGFSCHVTVVSKTSTWHLNNGSV
jgi:hypothetical protein